MAISEVPETFQGGGLSGPALFAMAHLGVYGAKRVKFTLKDKSHMSNIMLAHLQAVKTLIR